MIEAALKGGLDVVILVKRQLDPLSGEGFGGKAGEKQAERTKVERREKNKSPAPAAPRLNVLGHRYAEG